jgi:hypothetical protein
MPSLTEAPSRQILDETPGRALKFLGTVSRSKVIHALLAARGYTQAEHEQGWSLLLQVSGYQRAAPVTSEDPVVREAVVALDQWDEPNFRIVRAALDRRHPEQSAFVFDGGLGPQVGAAAVVSVATLLDRLDALESSPERKKTRKADHEALETLAKRGVDKAERERLRALVEIAKRPANDDDAIAAGDDEDLHASSDATSEGLLALRAWYQEWSEVARVVVKRRSDLIRLGLARRKPTSKSAPKAPSDPLPSPA